jgi:putative SOS response-associated peptidase YedK
VCGRYAAATDPAALVEEFEVSAPPEELLEPDFNVAPTKPVYIVVDRPVPDHEGARERALVVARWGLIPSWAKDPAIGSRMINARIETLAEKPAFRSAYAKRRCLVPADGYYEWYVPESGSARKQPFYIHPADGSRLAMAGLYEWWRDPGRPQDDPDAWRLTCTIITTDASDGIRRIHDRMPLLIARSSWGAWLDPAQRVDASTLIHSSKSVPLDAYPISTAVNSVRNNGSALIDPLAAQEPDALF